MVEDLTTTKEAGWALGTPFVIFGGIYGGIFTPTEAAGVAAVYSLVVTMFVYRDIGWRDLWHITLASVFLISQILIIVTAAGIYSWLLTTSGIPQSIIGAMNSLHLPRGRSAMVNLACCWWAASPSRGRHHDPHAAAAAGG
jgi:C4-dicarboxylate transporter DctM subunit